MIERRIFLVSIPSKYGVSNIYKKLNYYFGIVFKEINDDFLYYQNFSIQKLLKKYNILIKYKIFIFSTFAYIKININNFIKNKFNRKR